MRAKRASQPLHMDFRRDWITRRSLSPSYGARAAVASKIKDAGSCRCYANNAPLKEIVVAHGLCVFLAFGADSIGVR